MRGRIREHELYKALSQSSRLIRLREPRVAAASRLDNSCSESEGEKQA